MSKKIKLILLALVPLAVITLFFSFKATAPKPSSKESVQTGATLVIDYGGGKKETVSFTPQPGQSVFNALEAAATEKGIALETQQYDFGVFVKAIGGYESTAEMAWIYFINGTSGQVAADKQVVKDGDLIEWRYIKPEE